MPHLHRCCRPRLLDTLFKMFEIKVLVSHFQSSRRLDSTYHGDLVVRHQLLDNIAGNVVGAFGF